MSEINAPAITEAEDVAIELRPLEGFTTEGVRYERRPGVNEQIKKALSLASSEVVQRAQNSEWNSLDPNFLKEECLVYMIDEYRSRRDNKAVGALWEVILKRNAGRIRKRLAALGRALAEEAQNEVVHRLLEEVLDPFERGAFLQIGFGSRLMCLTVDVFRKYEARKKNEPKHVSIENLKGHQSEGTDNERLYELDDASEEYSTSPETLFEETENRLLLKEAIDAIPEENIREAVILRFMRGYMFHSKNPDEYTLEKHFGVPGDTVRSWIGKKAIPFLAKWIKDHE